MQRAEEEPYFLGILNRLGRPLEEHQFGVSSAFLYDLGFPDFLEATAKAEILWFRDWNRS